MGLLIRYFMANLLNQEAFGADLLSGLVNGLKMRNLKGTLHRPAYEKETPDNNPLHGRNVVIPRGEGGVENGQRLSYHRMGGKGNL